MEKNKLIKSLIFLFVAITAGVVFNLLPQLADMNSTMRFAVIIGIPILGLSMFFLFIYFIVDAFSESVKSGLFLVACIVIGYIVASASDYFDIHVPFYFWIIAVVACAVIFFIFSLGRTLTASAKYITIQRILYCDCDPAVFIEKMLNFKDTKTYRLVATGEPYHWTDTMFACHLSRGYAMDKNHEKAEEHGLQFLVLCEELKHPSEQLIMRFSAYTLLTSIYSEKGNINTATEYYEKFKEGYPSLFADVKSTLISKSYFENFPRNEEYLRAAFFAVEKNYKEALLIYEKIWEAISNNKNVSPLEKVSVQHDMATIYNEFGETENAEECLSYVAKHGNTTYMAREARKKLEVAQ